MAHVVHCPHSQITVEQFDTSVSLDIRIWWRNCLLVCLLHLSGESGSTFRIWNPRESPRLRPPSTRADIPCYPPATRLRRLQEQSGTAPFENTSMHTPPTPCQDWPLTPSVEESGLGYDNYATTSVADEEGMSILDAPTPAYNGGYQLEPLSRSISVASFGQHPTDLTFVPWVDWDRNGVYNNTPHINYHVNWKVFVNKKMVSRGTEPNVVLEPVSYGPLVLQPLLKETLQRKIAAPRAVEADDTEVVVSVTDRTEYDLVKEYKGIDIDWSVVQKQLLAWSNLFKKGKKLRVGVCFRYKESSVSITTDNSPSKLARKSATQKMLGELSAQVNAEHAATGGPPAWRDTYAQFRCPGPPCKFQPWCWFDSLTNKRYPLKVHHLKILIRHRESGHALDSHDDVPKEFRDLIYEEEIQSSRKKQLDTGASPNVAPIQITNVLPSHNPAESRTQTKSKARSIDIPGLRDVNIQDYCDWQKSQVSSHSWKDEFQKATDFVMANYLDLELLHQDQNPRLLVEEGQVHENIARQYIRDIEVYGAKRRKLNQSGDSSSS